MKKEDYLHFRFQTLDVLIHRCMGRIVVMERGNIYLVTEVVYAEAELMRNIVSVSEGKIALHSTPGNNVYVDVVFRDETFWMTGVNCFQNGNSSK